MTAFRRPIVHSDAELELIADHGRPPRGREWWACHYPERPLDGDVAFMEGCRPCQIALEAARARFGDFLMVRVDIESVTPTSSADVLAGWEEP